MQPGSHTNQTRNSKCRWLLFWLLGALLGSSSAVAAEAASADEYQIKAAYLYNFASFTEWPAPLAGPVTVCIYGPDPFGSWLDTALSGKTIDGQPLALVRTSTVEMLPDCQIVFVSTEVISNLPRVLDVLRNHSVLTVADSPGAAAAGVMLNMIPMADRIGFEVNLRRAREQGLSISLQLLRLAAGVIN